MNKLTKILILFCIYTLILGTTCFAGFSDVAGHWAEKEIKDFEEGGFVEGYLDGTFKPDQDITKAEFCKIINSYMGYEVSGEWQSANLEVARDKGYLAISKDASGDDNITREEAFVALSRVMKLETIDSILEFADTSEIAIWANDAVKSLVENKYIKGFPTNELKPKQNMKRAELVSILYQYIGIGGVDVEEASFAVGYMDSNEYGLEFKEFGETAQIEIGDILNVAATVSNDDGDVEFSVISGENVVEFDSDFMTLEALEIGEAEFKAVTTETKKEIRIKFKVN